MDISALLVLLGATLFTNEKSCEEIWKNEEDINICKEIAQLLQEINKKKFQIFRNYKRTNKARWSNCSTKSTWWIENSFRRYSK